jgi:hypothetical protein
MPKYKVTGSRVEYYSCETVIKAGSVQEAIELAEDSDLFDNAKIQDAHDSVEAVEEVE